MNTYYILPYVLDMSLIQNYSYNLQEFLKYILYFALCS